jgi:insertion element IS1 protein InsB
MVLDYNKCYKVVGGDVECMLCKGACVKHGKTKELIQRYKCKQCGKTFMEKYINKAYIVSNNNITSLLKEGCGISSMARLLHISCTTALKRIVSIAKAIEKPTVSFNKSYEVDELCTYCKCKTKLLWVVYALQKDIKRLVEFAVGSRTKTTVQKVISTLCMSDAVKINTDKLNLYGFIIPQTIHDTKQYGTNNIERKNLSLHTHLKRLNRRTISFSKSVILISVCLIIFFGLGNFFSNVCKLPKENEVVLFV